MISRVLSPDPCEQAFRQSDSSQSAQFYGEKIVSRSGMALLIVLVLIAMVSLSAYSYTLTMQNQYRYSRVLEDQVKARHAAMSGAEIVGAILALPDSQRAELGSLIDNPDLFQGIAVDVSPLETTAEDSNLLWRTSIIAPLPVNLPSASGSAMQERQADGDKNGFRFGIESESAKIHIPQLLEWDQQQPGYAKKVLLTLPGSSEAIVDAWWDRVKGSKTNAEFAEHAQRLWLGDDWNRNYRLDPMELSIGTVTSDRAPLSAGLAEDMVEPPSNSSRSLLENSQRDSFGWQQFLTWHSGERNENSLGRRRVYLNEPDLQELHRQLLKIWPSEWANFVVAYRQYGSAGIRLSGNRRSAGRPDTGTDSHWDTFVPDFSVPAAFSVASPLELIGASVRLPVDQATQGSGQVASRSSNSENLRLSSPFRNELASSGDYLGKLLDDITVRPEPTIHGRIDIFQSPLPVLRAVPGISQELAERIVQQRGSAQTDSPESGSSTAGEKTLTIGWLFEQGLVDLPKLAELEPFLTTRGDVYSCQVVGYKDDVHAVFRCTLTVDATSLPPTVRQLQTWHQWDRGFDVSSLHSQTPSMPRATSN